MNKLDFDRLIREVIVTVLDGAVAVSPWPVRLAWALIRPIILRDLTRQTMFNAAVARGMAKE